MSMNSAPYQSAEAFYTLPQYTRGTSLTLPRRTQTKFRNRNLKSVKSTFCEKNKPLNNQDEEVRFSSVSSDGNNQTCEKDVEDWDQLTAMTKQVENMRDVVNLLFSSVGVTHLKDIEIDYSGSTKYEIEVQQLRRTIEEQIIRMKTHWEIQGSRRNTISNEEDYTFEEMRLSISDLFVRMKPIVEGLVPSIQGEFIMTRARVDELKNQISNLESNVRQLAQTSKSPKPIMRQLQRTTQGYDDVTKPPPSYWSRQTSTVANESESRIRVLEEELKQSLEREEALQFKLKELEERKDEEIRTMEEQRAQLEGFLVRSENRASKATEEAHDLKMEVVRLEDEALEREHLLGVSERKRTDLEAQLAVRRGNEKREQVGQLRTSPDTHYRYKPDATVYRGNTPTNSPPESLQQLYRVKSPRRMSVCRERNNSVTSHSSYLDSPRERKHVAFQSEVPKMGYNTQLGRECRGPTNSTHVQPQRYLVGAS